MIGIVWVAIVIGDTIGFFIGRKLGVAFVERHAERFPTARRHFGRVEQFFRDHGGKSIFLGRWIGFARPLMPFTAGTSGMSYRRFLPYDILGAGTWGTTFCLLGYIFWRNFSDVTRLAGRGALALGLLILAIVFGVRAVRALRDPVERARWKAAIERQAAAPAAAPVRVRGAIWLWRVVLKPLWVIVGPPLRFTWKRLTPGELGIELTTLLAIAAVCRLHDLPPDRPARPRDAAVRRQDRARRLARHPERAADRARASGQPARRDRRRSCWS